MKQEKTTKSSFEPSEIAMFTVHHAQIRDINGKVIFDKKFVVHSLDEQYLISQEEAELLYKNGFAHLFKKI